MAKTTRFTYEGSSKFVKMIYLLGLGISNISFTGYCLLAIYVIFHYFTVGDKMFQESWWDFGYACLAAIILQIIGSSIYSFAQFLNWMDRGSVNSKIFRDPYRK